MKALVKQQAKPGIWLEEIAEPKLGPNDVLIEIAKTAICGTDMRCFSISWMILLIFVHLDLRWRPLKRPPRRRERRRGI